MCLIINRTKDSQVNWQAMERAARRNPDGYGVSYTNKQGLQTFKSMEWTEVRSVATRLEFQNLPFIMHMRFATHGAVTVDNCHPFDLQSHDTVMMHNGMIDTIDVPWGESDSRVLAEFLNEHMSRDFLNDDVSIELIEEVLDSRNKLVFMDGEGNVTIVNENLGEWVDGVWYSVRGACRTPRAVSFNPRNPLVDDRTITEVLN